MQRSDTLVHWTGKDLWDGNPDSLTDPIRAKFVARLTDILDHGFWMTMPVEQLCRGNKGNTLQGCAYKTPMTCFTEIRLSRVERHAKEYGHLGIGVTRRWVLDRMGGPVHYVRNTPHEFLVSNHMWITEWIQGLPSGVTGKTDALNYMAMLFAHLKGMSDFGKDDYHRLDENEWRVVFLHDAPAPASMNATGKARPTHLLSVAANDLACVVFPDAACRRLAISTCKSLAHAQCPLLTLAESRHF